MVGARSAISSPNCSTMHWKYERVGVCVCVCVYGRLCCGEGRREEGWDRRGQEDKR